MFCSNCGKEIPDVSNFCMYCGKRINNISVMDDYPLSDIEKFYENVMKNKVIAKLKSPSSSKWPRFNDDMIKIVGTLGTYTVIETYVDSTNAFGAQIRVGVRIKIDDNLNYGGVAFKEWNSLTYSLYRM